MSSPHPIQDSGSKQDTAGSMAAGNESYVKLAMRNMVRKGRKSLLHFALTTTGLVGLLLLLASLGHPLR